MAHNKKKSTVSKEALIHSAFDLMATKGWIRLSFSDIARQQKIKLQEIHILFPSKEALLEAMLQHVDHQALILFEANTQGLHNLSEKDRLFEALMARFEAAKPYKQSLDCLYKELKMSPFLLIDCMPLGFMSIRWLLDMSNIPLTSPLDTIQIKAFAVLYLRLLSIWFKDHSEDLSKTMAEINRIINQYLLNILHPERILDCIRL